MWKPSNLATLLIVHTEALANTANPVTNVAITAAMAMTRPYGNQDNRGYDRPRMERVVLPVGTEIALITNQRIDSRDVVEGQTFSAQIAEDIRDTDGSIAIPRGSEASLITRRLEGNGDITLDVESIAVGGRRYRVSTSDQELESRRDGVGGNKRTGSLWVPEPCLAQSSVRLQAAEKRGHWRCRWARVPEPCADHHTRQRSARSCRNSASFPAGPSLKVAFLVVTGA